MGRNLPEHGKAWKPTNLERIKNCARISESDKLNRDIPLYSLWQEGMYTNLQIGDLLGLTHSSLSRRMPIIRQKMALEQNFQRRVEAIKSQIKPWPHYSDRSAPAGTLDNDWLNATDLFIYAINHLLKHLFQQTWNGSLNPESNIVAHLILQFCEWSIY